VSALEYAGTREQIVDDIRTAAWPDGGHDGFPSSKVAGMIADHLLAKSAEREERPSGAGTGSVPPREGE